jgi:phosphoglycolate phosphatase
VPPATDAVVLFDLDGVLADSRGPITACINLALADHGLPTQDPATLARHIGPPLPDAFAEIVGAPVGSEIVLACIASYRERYAVASLTDTDAFPGIAEAVTALADAGHRLGVATSKPRPFAEPLLEALGLRAFFAVVAGPDLDLTAQSKTETVGQALAALDARCGAMVGDRSFDMIAARAHGLRAVGVGWGIGSRDELTAAGADVIVAAPAELPAAVAA